MSVHSACVFRLLMHVQVYERWSDLPCLLGFLIPCKLSFFGLLESAD